MDDDDAAAEAATASVRRPTSAPSIRRPTGGSAALDELTERDLR